MRSWNELPDDELSDDGDTMQVAMLMRLAPRAFAGWIMLNLGMTAHAVQRNGSVGAALLLVNAFQLLYVVDSVWFESAILTTMDITQEGFGFMLVCPPPLPLFLLSPGGPTASHQGCGC